MPKGPPTRAFIRYSVSAGSSPALLHRGTCARAGDGKSGGRPILGSHKTWRGLITGTVAALAVFEMQALAYDLGSLRELALIDYGAHPVLPGFLISFGALARDSIKSFFKRQIGIRSGASWLFFDQLDFFFGASLFLLVVQPLPLWPWLAALPIVFVCDIAVTATANWLGLKEAWI